MVVFVPVEADTNLESAMPKGNPSFWKFSATLAVVGLATSAPASASSKSEKPYTLKTIYSVGAESGSGGELVSAPYLDQSGNIYITAFNGGAYNGGTVEELIPAPHGKWRHKVLYSFCAQDSCADGANPHSGVVADAAGNLYGTTYQGGAMHLGVAYELQPNSRRTKWKLKVLHDFCSEGGADCTDGEFVPSGLTYQGAITGAPYDGVSPLYGTTANGGSGEVVGGVIYSLKPGGRKWKQTVLYSFCPNGNCSSGATPQNGSLLVDADGNLFGTASGAGQHGVGGTIFELNPNARKTKWKQTTLHSFCATAGCTDGYNPIASLLIDASGNLFGATPYGGTKGADCTEMDPTGTGCGVVFELAPHGSASQETVLYRFCASSDCADGAIPPAGLVMSGSGDIFGTTTYGGGHDTDTLGYGGGTVFKLNGGQQVIHSFCSEADCADGEYPMAGLILDKSGNIYGTTFFGGAFGVGSVFELSP